MVQAAFGDELKLGSSSLGPVSVILSLQFPKYYLQKFSQAF
jgi:hypothetical protein